ncbi:beta strand repeat-containing protein [Streptomyces sp. NPDC088353]|uniref:beta strand repeat-containing protein n=1 Tax=Streptomyces sp. NPDC088353 TaxID=3365855 RepID=UPI003817AE9A
MARLWSCGFELQSAAAGIEFDTPTGTLSISTSVTHAGSSASLRSNPTSGTGYFEHQIGTGSPVKKTFHRFYLRIAVLPSAATTIYAVGQSGYFPCHIRLYPTGALRLYDSFTSTEVGTSSSPLSTGVWYRVEIDHTDAASSATLAPVVASLDGVAFSGTAQISGIGGFSRIRAGVQTAATADVYIDDIAVNDANGTSQTALPGPGAIVHLRPAATGDSNGWATTAGGTAGAANNWTRVSEVTPDDATSYNQTATASVTDDFKVDASLAAGIPAGSTISLVQVGMRAGSTATTSGPTATLRIKGQASGTVSSSAAVAINTNGFATNGAAAPRVYPLTAYTNPQGGAAWTTTALDTAQIGYNSGTGTTTRRVSTLWALVDYVPSEGGGGEPTAYTTVTGPASGGTSATTSQTSHAVTVPGAVAGETIVLLIGSGNAAVSSVSSPGMTWTLDVSTVWYSYLYAYSAPVTASGTVTITVTTSAASNATSQAYRVTGITGRDRTVTGHDSNGSPSLTTAATSQANEVVFGAYSVFAGSGTDRLTPDAGYTGASSNNTPTSGQTVTLNTLWQALGTIGAQTPSGALDYSTTWDGLAVTYKTSTPPPPVVRPADTATLTDAATAKRESSGQQLTAKPADTTALGDGAAAARQVSRTPTDTGLLGDQTAGVRTQARAAADTGTLADSAARAAGMGRASADTGTVADAATAAASRARTAADAGLLADAAAAVRATSVQDGASLADQANPTRGRSQPAGDTAALADAQASKRTTAGTDTGTLADGLTAVRSASREAADPAVLSDAATPARIGARADAATVTDTAAAHRSTVSADSAALADTVTTGATRPATAGDAAALADTTARTAARARTAADGTVLGDTATASRYTVSHEQPADTAALGDTAATTAGRARAAADSTALADAARTARATTRADTAALTDGAVTAQARAAGVADGIALADTATTIGSRVRTVADTAAATDDVSSSQSTRETFHTRDPASLADTPTATAGRVRTAPDSTAATDTATAGRGLPGTDRVSLGDHAATVYGHVATPADTTSLTDTAAAAQTRTEALTNPVLLQDSGSAARKALRPQGDTSALADGASSESQRERTSGDGGTLADHADALRGTPAADAGRLVDTAALTVARGQGAADVLVFADAVTAVYQRTVTVEDPARLVDEDARALTAIRTAADALQGGDATVAVPVHGVTELAHLTSTVDALAERARSVQSKVVLIDRAVAHRRGPLDIVLTVVPLPSRWDTALLSSGWDLPLLRSGGDVALLPSGWDTPELLSGWETQLLDG